MGTSQADGSDALSGENVFTKEHDNMLPDNRTYIRKGHKSVMVWSLSLKAEIKMLLPCIFYRLGAWNGQIDQLI